MITVVTWNTEWREPRSRDGILIRDRLNAVNPDIVCLTEAHVDFLADWGGFIAEGGTDWGGPAHGTRRKVILWSRYQWNDIDNVGSTSLPPGMFIKGMTDSGAGPVTVVGIVIPFHLANVTSGRRDRKMWGDHRQYLNALQGIIDALPPRSIVLGDFNQRIPSTWVPEQYQRMRASAFKKMHIATTELRGPDGKLSVDHIAYGQDLLTQGEQIISNFAEEGRKISDHFGVVVQLSVG